MSSRERCVSMLAVAVLVALVVLFANRLALSNLILARGDVYLYFYPYWETAAAALREARLPLWNPAIFMGAPFLANSQAGFFYPLNWPLWLIFSTPYAVSATVVIHLFIAGLGTFLLGRRGLALSPPGALLAAVLFALGGYLTAQIEHVNQLQGLAWLPWHFLVLMPFGVASPRPISRRGFVGSLLGVAILFSLQLLAGHTQTAFISGVAVAVWALVQVIQQREQNEWRDALVLGGVLLAAVSLALLLAAVQLGPTLELTSLSARQDGLSLPEVLSFSWHPLHAARSLLPAYGQSLFTEYVAVLPLTGLLLAFIGVWSWRERPALLAWIVLAVVGLVLALGQFTPLYWGLARLPGFDLFRVPARWLVLYALGTAVLAGAGWDVLRARLAAGQGGALARPLAVGAVLILALMIWGFAAGWLDGLIPTGQEAPYEVPGGLTLFGWLIELGLLAGLLVIAVRRPGMAEGWLTPGVVALAVAVLWLATRSLPYNHPTTPEAYFDLRPPIARLQAVGSCVVPERPCPQPPERVLSLSEIQFDPGDMAEIETIYAGQLGEQAWRDYIVAIKQKEIVSPNLPMVFGLSSVDGFDGGILPLKAYATAMQLLLPPGIEATDGRLREYLPAVPEQRWLDLFNTRYLITDKVGDVWVEGVFFDRQHPVTMAAGEEGAVGFVPPFEATALQLVGDGPAPDLTVTTGAGETWSLSPVQFGEGRFQAILPAPGTPQRIGLVCPATGPSCQIDGLTLVDGRDGAFQPLVPGPYRLIHSGDIKLYENLSAQPRAFLVYDWVWQADQETVLASMQANDFDPRRTAVLLGGGQSMPDPPVGEGVGAVTVVDYAPERVTMRVQSDLPGLLVITDAMYPGWQATVDGRAVDLLTANSLFRAVPVPAGEHEVVMTYGASALMTGAVLSVIGLLVIAVGLVYLVWTRRP